jgi:hypothetical protein
MNNHAGTNGAAFDSQFSWVLPHLKFPLFFYFYFFPEVAGQRRNEHDITPSAQRSFMVGLQIGSLMSYSFVCGFRPEGQIRWTPLEASG